LLNRHVLEAVPTTPVIGQQDAIQSIDLDVKTFKKIKTR